jgi:hypothetical protein
MRPIPSPLFIDLDETLIHAREQAQGIQWRVSGLAERAGIRV